MWVAIIFNSTHTKCWTPWICDVPTLAVKITVRVSENNRCALLKIVDSSLFLITSIKVHRSLKELWPHWRGNDWKKIVFQTWKTCIIWVANQHHQISIVFEVQFHLWSQKDLTGSNWSEGTWLVEMPSVLPEARMAPCKAPQHPQGLRIWGTLS